MKKNDYIDMLIAENTDTAKQKLYADVIDSIYIALSQESDDFEVADTSESLAELFGIIESTARKAKCNCVGPFEAAELFAAKFGANFIRPSLRTTPKPAGVINLADFL